MTQGSEILILLFGLMAGAKAMFGRREPKVVLVISVVGCIGIGAMVALSIQAGLLIRLGVALLVASISFMWISLVQYLRRGQPL